MKAYQGDSKRGQKRGIHKNYLIYMFFKSDNAAYCPVSCLELSR